MSKRNVENSGETIFNVFMQLEFCLQEKKSIYSLTVNLENKHIHDYCSNHSIVISDQPNKYD